MWNDFVGIFARPLAGLLSFFYEQTHSYAAAITLLTVAVMLVLFPLNLKSMRSMLAMQRLGPEVKRLGQLHKDDKLARNEATMKLYRDNKINPLSGCFPILAQLPVFFLLYHLIYGLSRFEDGRPAPLYLSEGSQMFQDLQRDNGQMLSLGFDFADKATDAHGSIAGAAPFWILIALMVAVNYWSTHLTLKRSMSDKSDPQAQMMVKVQKFFPFIIGVISINFVAGLVFYWMVSALFRVAQTWGIYRFDPHLKTTVAAAKKEAAEMIARDSRPSRANSGAKKTSSSSKSKKKRKGR